jgi:hypothetical protein
MTGPSYKTKRARRTTLERLKGYVRVYATEISEGLRSVRARGPSPEASLAEAERLWLATVRDEDGPVRKQKAGRIRSVARRAGRE